VRPSTIPLGRWLVDVAPGHAGKPTLAMHRVLKVGEETVRLEDEHGNKFVSNRLMLEGQLQRGELVDGADYLKTLKKETKR
jgi:hypothetical protein